MTYKKKALKCLQDGNYEEYYNYSIKQYESSNDDQSFKDFKEAKKKFELYKDFKELTNKENVSHYEVLGVDKNAEPSKIKTAYTKLTSKFNPDNYKIKESDDATKIIQNAYDILSDKEKRREYDLEKNKQIKKQAEKFSFDAFKDFDKKDDKDTGFYDENGKPCSEHDYNKFGRSVYYHLKRDMHVYPGQQFFEKEDPDAPADCDCGECKPGYGVLDDCECESCANYDYGLEEYDEYDEDYCDSDEYDEDYCDINEYDSEDYDSDDHINDEHTHSDKVISTPFLSRDDCMTDEESGYYDDDDNRISRHDWLKEGRKAYYHEKKNWHKYPGQEYCESDDSSAPVDCDCGECKPGYGVLDDCECDICTRFWYKPEEDSDYDSEDYESDD
nr:unnamed protein product [Papilio xuthus]